MKLSYKVSTNYPWNSPKLKEIKYWLNVNVSPPYKMWITCYEGGLLQIKFLNEKDAILFALRWS